MAVVRDVIAHFAVSVDDSKLTKMDKSLDRLKDKVKKFAVGTAAAFTAAGYAGYKLVTAASDANESLNVLQQTFKDGQDAVVEWSRTVAREMGRSEYEFQDSVGKFGAFLTPIFKGSNRDIAMMSKELSALAVDLASFYNTSDQEATMRLFSGMSGETEAVRRYGIDISDAALDAFNAASGDTRTMRSLTMAEKSILRYRKILQDTTLAQGDAVKTASEWANQVRRLQSRLKTIAVDMGRKLMPFAKKLLGYFNKIIDLFEDWRKHLLTIVSVFNTILLMGGSYVAIWAILNRQMLMGLGYMVQYALQARFGADWLKKGAVSAGMMAGKMLIVAGAFLAIQDVFGFLSGQKSVIGDLFKSILGTNNPLGRLKRVAEVVMGLFKNAFHYVKNSVALVMALPEIVALRAQGKGDQADNLKKGIMGDGIVDVGAEHAARDAAKSKAFSAWVRVGGQAGLEGATKEGNLGINEDKADGELRYLKERAELIRKSLTPGMRGNVSAGQPLGDGLSATSEDIAQGFVPKEYLKNGSLTDAMTLTQGEVTFGEVHVHVTGGDLKDPKATGDKVKSGLKQAMSGRKK